MAKAGWFRVGLAFTAVLTSACSRYDQSTPQATLESARQMVRDGRADRLVELVEADSRGMKRFLGAVGRLMKHSQQLADQIGRSFPEEVSQLRRDADEALARGEATTFLGRLMAGQRGRGARAGSGDPLAASGEAIRGLLADPFAWLGRHGDRLSVEPLTDDLAAILWDGKPVFGPLVGLTMRLDGGRWRVVLPFHALPAWMAPRSDDDWFFWEQLIGTLDNAVVDLRREIASGEVGSLDEASQRAGELMFLPVAMAMVAYGNYVEERNAEQREAGRRAPTPGS